MPEHGYYEKRPRPEHRRFLTGYLDGRPNVRGIDEVDDFRLIIHRHSQSDVFIYLSNQYTLGLADVMEILELAPETTCIVSTMDYNQYTPEAKQFARQRGVGLFKATEFLGAVYFEGDRFLDYLPPKDRDRLRRQGRA